jgi:hypothetical protein
VTVLVPSDFSDCAKTTYLPDFLDKYKLEAQASVSLTPNPLAPASCFYFQRNCGEAALSI